MNITQKCFKQTCLSLLKMNILFVTCLSTALVYAQQTTTSNSDDEVLLNQFIKSKGYVQIIVFDSTNIKQFWTDRNVISRNNLIEVVLNANNKSSPQKIQLTNVLETQDCKVDIITENNDMSFSVVDSNANVLSNSSIAEPFLQYNILSSTFHIEDLNDFSFGLVFLSEKSDILQVKKIVLSFSTNENSAYAGSPGFDQLRKLIDQKGIAVPDNDARYLISKDNGKIFVEVPTDIAEGGRFIYHVFPSEKKDLEPNRIDYGFNNYDFRINADKVVIHKPYLSKDRYTIVQYKMPSYECSKIKIGAEKDGKILWLIEIKDPLSIK